MSKIIDAEDIIGDAKLYLECMFMAMNELEQHEADPLQAVALVAKQKIDEALALLGEVSAVASAPAAPDAKPKSPAARTKRKGK